MIDYYLFPFAKIKQGSRIVLYGAGIVGRSYAHQIRESGYCELVLWVDQYPECEDVATPDAITLLGQDMYDLIVLAVEHQRYAREMKTRLLDTGVAEAKIFFEPPKRFFYRGYANVQLEQLLKNPSGLHDVLQEYYSNSDGHIDYLQPLIEQICAAAEDSKKLERIAELTCTVTGVDRLVFLRALYEAGALNADLLREYVCEIGRLEDVNEKYWLTMDLFRITFNQPSIRYREYYKDRRELFKDIASAWQLEYLRTECKSNGSNRICVLVELLWPGDQFSPMRATANIVNEAERLGYQLVLIPIAPATKDSMASFLKPQYYSNKRPARFEAASKAWLDNPEITRCPTEIKTKARQQEILNMIYDFDPAVIIDMTNDYSPLSYVYSQQYPTVFFPMGALENSSFYHKIAWADPNAFAAARDYWQCVEDSQWMQIKLYYDPSEPKRRFLREEHGLAEADFVLVTVSYRLNQDITASLVDEMAKVLNRHPQIKWILVGDGGAPSVELCCAELIGKQILLWGYEHDLAGLYQICDVYVNPVRIGGGTSIAWAMQHGLAVATPVGADAGHLIVQDVAIEGNEKNLALYVEQLLIDEKLLKQNKARMKEITATMDRSCVISETIDKVMAFAHAFQ